MREIFLPALAAAAALTAVPAFAQEYPARTVRMIVTFPPGGGADLLARIVGKQLTEKWGQTVQVDNRAGGDGANGVERWRTRNGELRPAGDGPIDGVGGGHDQQLTKFDAHVERNAALQSFAA